MILKSSPFSLLQLREVLSYSIYHFLIGLFSCADSSPLSVHSLHYSQNDFFFFQNFNQSFNNPLSSSMVCFLCLSFQAHHVLHTIPLHTLCSPMTQDIFCYPKWPGTPSAWKAVPLPTPSSLPSGLQCPLISVNVTSPFLMPSLGYMLLFNAPQRPRFFSSEY